MMFSTTKTMNVKEPTRPATYAKSDRVFANALRMLSGFCAAKLLSPTNAALRVVTRARASGGERPIA
jgi:hypothetical protein